MKIVITKRLEHEAKTFHSGEVRPEVDFTHGMYSPGQDEELIFRNEMAKGIIFQNTWYELPDNPDGDYVFLENVPTNYWGYYEGGKSTITLETRKYTDTLDQQVGAGILNQVGTLKIRGQQVKCTYDKKSIVNKQG
jgi:hypothetical protein